METLDALARTVRDTLDAAIREEDEQDPS